MLTFDKKLFFLGVFCLLPLASFAQFSNIDGFWGLKFGISRNETLEKLEAKVPASQIEINRTEKIFIEANTIWLKNITFGGEIFQTCFLSFHDDKLYRGMYGQSFASEILASDFKDTLERSLSKKYGEGVHIDNRLVTWEDSLRKTQIFLSLEILGKSDEFDVRLSYIRLVEKN